MENKLSMLLRGCEFATKRVGVREKVGWTKFGFYYIVIFHHWMAQFVSFMALKFIHV
jgi:hypothetical protein